VRRTKHHARPRQPPADVAALESDDGSVVVLSFAIDDGPGTGLSPAESEVAAHILKGRTNAQIAKIRSASERTVANQVANVFRKLGVSSRLELVALAPLLGATSRSKQ
jgi:DNA-binding CsgD family transcriptional regulator